MSTTFYNDNEKSLYTWGKISNPYDDNIKKYICQKCLKEYKTKRIIRHFQECHVDFENIFNESKHTIIEINKKSDIQSRKIAATFGNICRRVVGWDFPQIDLEHNSDSSQTILILRTSQRLIGYIAFENKFLRDENEVKFSNWVFIDFFIFPSYHRKGYGSYLFDYAVKYLGINTSNIFISVPLTDASYEFLRKKDITTFNAVLPGSWCNLDLTKKLPFSVYLPKYLRDV